MSEAAMNRLSHMSIRVAVLATPVVAIGIGSAGRAAAISCVDPLTGSRRFCPRLDDGYDGSGTQVQQVTDNSDRTLQWLLFAAAAFSALAILALVTDLLARRRWRQPPLETALANDPDELPRAAGLLGDQFAQQDHSDAAEHAYRAAIDAGDDYWSPIAQVALAELLSDRGEHAEAQALLEAALGSGEPRAVHAARNCLNGLETGKRRDNTLSQTFETLG